MCWGEAHGKFDRYRVSYPSHLFVHHPEETEAFAGPRCVVYDLDVIHLSELLEEGCEAVDRGRCRYVCVNVGIGIGVGAAITPSQSHLSGVLL